MIAKARGETFGPFYRSADHVRAIRRAMRALTVRQPFAWAIVAGHKDVENRTWSTDYRGFFLIHAARLVEANDFVRLKRRYGLIVPKAIDVGAIIGVARLADCEYEGSKSRWSLRRNFHWELRDAVAFRKPIEYVGKRGWFDVPLNVEGLTDELIASKSAAMILA